MSQFSRQNRSFTHGGTKSPLRPNSALKLVYIKDKKNEKHMKKIVDERYRNLMNEQGKNVSGFQDQAPSPPIDTSSNTVEMSQIMGLIAEANSLSRKMEHWNSSVASCDEEPVKLDTTTNSAKKTLLQRAANRSGLKDSLTGYEPVVSRSASVLPWSSQEIDTRPLRSVTPVERIRNTQVLLTTPLDRAEIRYQSPIPDMLESLEQPIKINLPGGTGLFGKSGELSFAHHENRAKPDLDVSNISRISNKHDMSNISGISHKESYIEHKESIHDFYEGIIAKITQESEHYKSLYNDSLTKIDDLQKIQKKFTQDSETKRILNSQQEKLESLSKYVSYYKSENARIKAQCDKLQSEAKYANNRRVAKLKERIFQQQMNFEKKEFGYKMQIEKLTASKENARPQKKEEIGGLPLTTQGEEELFREIRDIKSRLKSYY